MNFNQILRLWRIMQIKIAKNYVALFLHPETTICEPCVDTLVRIAAPHPKQENDIVYFPDEEPTPMTVVSLTRSVIPQLSKIPEIWITPPLAAAAVRAEHDVTVVPLPLPPPVVPDAYPTRLLIAAVPHVFVAVATVVCDVVDVFEVV